MLPNKPFTWPKELTTPPANTEVLIMGTNPRLPVRLMSHLRQLHFQQIYRLGIDLRVPLNHDIQGAGNDRVAGALGAQQAFPNSTCLIVSAGSAVTLDLISPKGYKGGAISIGLGAYKKAMATINPALTTCDEKDSTITFPTNCTSKAVFLGWQMPLKAAIAEQAKLADQIIFSGGDATHLQNDKIPSTFRPWLAADAMATAMGANANVHQVINDPIAP
jgi:pantothenate kinase type III